MDEIFTRAYQSSASHQKNILALEKIFDQTTNYETFVKRFSSMIKCSFKSPPDILNPFNDRAYEFGAKFLLYMHSKYDADPASEGRRLLTDVVTNIVKHCKVIVDSRRYNACKFIATIFQRAGGNMHLNDEVCDIVEKAMLERLGDPKHQVKIQAVIALVRLQEPQNPECPVIKHFLTLLLEKHSEVRKAVLEVIAPAATTINAIKERTRDINSAVRNVAFKRVADIGPRFFKIVDRRKMLHSGFIETHPSVKSTFVEIMVRKWLTAYNGNCLVFVKSIKLDADEKDIEETAMLTRALMSVFFKILPMNDIIKVLSLGQDKLLPIQNISSDLVTYWHLLIDHLKDNEIGAEYLDEVLPELTPFCNHIEALMKEKLSKPMNNFEYLEYEFILETFVEMAGGFDFSDEVGREALKNLLSSILLKQHINFKLMKKICNVMVEICSTPEAFCTELCHIISEIQEPLIDTPIVLTAHQISDMKFRLARLEVNIDILKNDKQNAIDKQEFSTISLIDAELTKCNNEAELIRDQMNAPTERIIVSDTDKSVIICRCLDLLAGVLLEPSVKKITCELQTCKEIFLTPLISSEDAEIYQRALQCLGLFCLVDPTLITKENVKILARPVLCHRSGSDYNQKALIVSVKIVTDLLRHHIGEQVFAELGNNSNTTIRRLYSEDTDDPDENVANAQGMFQSIFDMIENEDEEIRTCAMNCINTLAVEFPLSEKFISRVILKWYNPILEKEDPKLQQKLGIMIERYQQTVPTAKEVIHNAILPTITTIANAPKTSPISDINTDNVFRFLSFLCEGSNAVIHFHTNLALSIGSQISNNPQDICVPLLCRMLLYLDVPPTENTVQELINTFELVLNLKQFQDIHAKSSKNHVEKFLHKLRRKLPNEEVAPVENGLVVNGVESDTENSTSINSVESAIINDDAFGLKSLCIRLPNLPVPTEDVGKRKRSKVVNGNIVETRSSNLNGKLDADKDKSLSSSDSESLRRSRRGKKIRKLFR